jgi:hypothetical protein
MGLPTLSLLTSSASAEISFMLTVRRTAHHCVRSIPSTGNGNPQFQFFEIGADFRMRKYISGSRSRGVNFG